MGVSAFPMLNLSIVAISLLACAIFYFCLFVLSGAEEQAQGLMHARQAFYHGATSGYIFLIEQL